MAGLEYRGTHALRHTFATLGIDAGVPVEVIAEPAASSTEVVA